MALTVELTKVAIVEPQPGMVVLTVNMVLLEGVEEVYNQNFSIRKKDGISLGVIKERLQERLQAAIDKFLREQAIYNMSVLDSAIAEVEAALVTE